MNSALPISCPQNIHSSEYKAHTKSSLFRKVTFIQIAKRVIYSSFMYGIYKVAAFACALFGFKATASDLNWKASYHETRISSSKGAYHTFGKHLISFSLNRTQRNPHSISSNSNTFDTLRTIYGTQLEQAVRQGNTRFITIDPAKLKHLDEGICQGISLDFIANVLHRSNPNESEIDAVRRISTLYAEGSSSRAEIIQMIQHARDTTRFDQYMRERQETVLNSLSVASLSDHDIEQIGKTLDLETEKIRFGIYETILNINFQPEEFKSLSNIKPGIYSLYSPTHSMVYFCTDKTAIIFDPNRGAVELSNKADLALIERDLIQHYCKDNSRLRLVKCSV